MTSYAEVIGDPIDHSKSPIIHGFWLDALEIEARYARHRVESTDLAGYFAERAADPDWRGCNVTLPHKEAALDHLPDPAGLRQSIGAVNTVFRSEDDALVATNTDAAGFYAPLGATDLVGAHVALVGSGGAARAILFALSRIGAAHVTLMARNPLKGAGLLAAFKLKGDIVPLDTPLPPVDLLVNASVLGMAGQAKLDIDLDPLPDHAIVYDIVYAPLETPLLAAARARELATIDGLEMLIGQAALAFELFFGVEAPRDKDAELRALLTA
ncbi:shikimate dehydrogenase family protein [Sphingomonas sp. 37zxx]|uniref:shikimate dehydrogenase family protein n=1 Tax=Sphingomonas sp. 37zxx TaxID=1550073 RepID=UPI00053BDA08|nr:shikimate dehydrogenase [Sphingomonas sp. 37zxx]